MRDSEGICRERRKEEFMAKTYQLTTGMKLVNTASRALLRIGLPLGSTYLLTVKGRKSGRLFTTPVTLIEDHERRWLVSPYGESTGFAKHEPQARCSLREDVTAKPCPSSNSVRLTVHQCSGNTSGTCGLSVRSLMSPPLHRWRRFWLKRHITRSFSSATRERETSDHQIDTDSHDNQSPQERAVHNRHKNGETS
jgi:F420H(2)-dependent quinone reductase